jgi:hypothetical protein
MARICAGGPGFPLDPNPPQAQQRQPVPALENPAAMARLCATFVDSHDGWVDDNIAFVQPWGFDMDAIVALVGIWYGTRDTTTPNTHSEWLLSHIPTQRTTATTADTYRTLAPSAESLHGWAQIPPVHGIATAGCRQGR